MFTGEFVQRNGPGGAVRGVGGGIVMGWIGRPEMATIGGGNHGRCTPAVLFSRDGLGGAVAALEGEFGSERVGSRALGRGGNRRCKEWELVTRGGQVTVPCWTWQEPAGFGEKCQKSRKTKEIQG